MSINPVFKDRHKKIHLVGIGGIGMSGIAQVLLESGFKVSGSDLQESAITEGLARFGAEIFIGHHPDNLGDADVLVYSSAVSFENPELLKAEQNNIPIIPRALMLAELMRLRCGIAISGAHGKTTTTSLIGTLMHKAGLDPTVVIGGIVNHFASNAVVGKSQYMVTEADESDGTFLHLSPTIAVVTNIDAEHLDFYPGGIEEITARFKDFLEKLPFYGLGVVYLDDPHLKSLLGSINRRIITYGFSPDAMYRADNLVFNGFATSFDLLVNGRFITNLTLNMVGHHNVLNCLAALVVLEEIGIAPASLAEVLKDFNGIKRRFSPVSTSDDFLVIDDYAHHPTEIAAVIKAARLSFLDRKIRVLFQPHRYSRTKDLLEEFSTCFKDCDSLVITEIYAASETTIEGINAQTLVQKVQEKMSIAVHQAFDLDDGAEQIALLSEKNDVVLTLGAGSITKAAPKIAMLLKMKHGHAL